jgi:hypothetical protein
MIETLATNSSLLVSPHSGNGSGESGGNGVGNPKNASIFSGMFTTQKTKYGPMFFYYLLSFCL